MNTYLCSIIEDSEDYAESFAFSKKDFFPCGPWKDSETFHFISTTIFEYPYMSDTIGIWIYVMVNKQI